MTTPATSTLTADIDHLATALPGSPGEEWLVERGIAPDIARRARVGWDGDSAALVFPLCDATGQVLSLHLRSVGAKKLWRRGSGGMFIARFGVEGGDLYVCEGQVDALRLATVLDDPGATIIGVPGTSSWASAWSSDWKRVEFCRVVAIPDADDAGSKMLDAIRVDIADVCGVCLPEGLDLTDAFDADQEYWLNEIRDALVAGPPRVHLVCLADVEARPVEWLWQNYIPRGALTLSEGDPETGKTTSAYDILARVTTGSPMPFCEHATASGAVLVLSAEEGMHEAIRPKLEAAGADLTKVHLMQMRDEESPDGLRSFEVTTRDLRDMETTIRRLEAKAALFDPLVGFLPDATDTRSDHKTRRVIQRLARLAQKTGIAIIGIRHHTKAEGVKAIHRGGGSIAFSAVARSVLVFARDQHDESAGVMAVVKNNQAPRANRPSLKYRIVEVMVPGAGKVPRVEWTGVSDMTADDLVARHLDREERSQLDEAMDFLRQELPLPAAEITARAEQAGIAERTLNRAKATLGGKSAKQADGTWRWELPSDTLASLAPLASFTPDAGSETVSRVPTGPRMPRVPSELSRPPCPYPGHREHDWKAPSGHLVCGLCHPPANGLAATVAIAKGEPNHVVR